MNKVKVLATLTITEEEIQLFAIDFLKRKLTDIELNRIIVACDEIDNFQDYWSDLLSAVVVGVTKDPNEWTGIDEDFVKKPDIDIKNR